MADRDELDRDLVFCAQEGDEAAFTALVVHYKGPILSFVFRLIGDAVESEDVAQDVFVRAYRNLNRFVVRGPDDRFSSWLFHLARNTAIDELRRRHRRPPSVPDEQAVATPAHGADPARDAAGREREQAVAAAVAELPEDQRTALSLAVYEGRSYAETATIMGSSAKSVEARLYRARQFLRRRLERFLG
jgi:RNA polymerase sigma-70 factor (ECF subfamily)